MKALKTKIFLLPEVYIDFESERILSIKDEKMNIELTPHEVRIIKFLCTQNNNSNNGYVTNEELFTLIYGNPYKHDGSKPDIQNITRAMSKLRAKHNSSYNISVSGIIESNNRGAFKIRLEESPFEEDTTNLKNTNPIADYINQYRLPRFNFSSLRYDAENTLFCGRTHEMNLLTDFLRDERPVLWWAITGNGGSGKSRLAFEFIKALNLKQIQITDTNWKAVMVEWNGFYSHINKVLNEMSEWCASYHYLIIVDYVQSFEHEIANFIQALARLSWHNAKVRVLLLERARKTKDKDNNKYEPLWFHTFKSGWLYIDWLNGTCYNKEFIDLKSLDRDSECSIVKSYVNSKQKIISDEECQVLVDYVETIGIHGATPLLLLCVAETWLDSPMFYNKPERISSSSVWKQIIEKEKREIVHSFSGVVSEALLDIHIIACIIHRLELKTETIDALFNLKRFKRYQHDKSEIITKLFESRYVIRMNYAKYIAAIEPDIIGEYFVYTILQDYSEDEYKDLFSFLYKNYKKETDRFFWRFSSDFNTIASKHPGYQFCIALIFGSIKNKAKDKWNDSLSDSEIPHAKMTFKATNSDGIETECEVLFTFDSEETGKSYMVYTDDTKDESGKVRVYASVYTFDGVIIELLPIETEAEWEMIDAILCEL